MKKYDDKYLECPACHSIEINDYHSDFRGNFFLYVIVVMFNL